MTADERQEAIFQFLKRESAFGHIGQAALEKLAALGQIQVVSKGERLFCAGQPCRKLHFLVEGQAEVLLLSREGRQRILHLVLPGDMVGAVPFFDGKDYPCTVLAAVDCRFLALRRHDLLDLLTCEAEVTLSILGGLVARQRKIVGHLEELSFEDTSSRLWHYLLERSRTPDGTFPRIVESLPTRENIASAVGTVREVVSRRLSHLVKTGHISIDGRTLTLHKPLE